MGTLTGKLGFRPGVGVQAWRVPDALRAPLADLLAAQDQGSASPFRIAFARDAAELAQAADEVAAHYQPGGHLWLCYPKKSGRIRSDLTRDHGWEPIAALGLLAVTQISLDEGWSALRFRKREEIKRLTRRSQQQGS